MPGGTFSVPDQTLTSRVINLDWATADVLATETSTSTSYTNLATTGPSVTLSPGIAQDHEIQIGAEMRNSNSTNYGDASPSIAGASAIDDNAAELQTQTSGSGFTYCQKTTISSAIASGSTHASKYKTTANTGSFANRRILAKAL